MIMLSIIGVGVAHWSEIIKINGIVETGSLTVGFIDKLCVDKEFKEDLLKDVGILDCWFDEPVIDPHTNKTGWRKLWINITNAYPTYYVECTFVVQNLGTVPAIFTNITITLVDTPGYVVNEITPNTLWDIKNATTLTPVINMEVVNLVGLQLDVCNKTKAQLDIHFKQEVPECSTFKFLVEIEAVNWNG